MPFFSFPKHMHLLSKGQFKRISLSSHRVAQKYIVVQWIKNGLPFSRLGITASRKFGKAYKRNRFKRIAREAFRLLQHRLPKGVDILVKPRSRALKASCLDLMDELKIVCENDVSQAAPNLVQ